MNKPINRAAERLRQCVGARPRIRDESPENPPRHRGRVGPWGHRSAAEVLRLHRVKHQGQAHEFGIHRHDRGQFDPEKKADGGDAVSIVTQRIRGFWKFALKPMNAMKV